MALFYRLGSFVAFFAPEDFDDQLEDDWSFDQPSWLMRNTDASPPAPNIIERSKNNQYCTSVSLGAL